MNIGFANEHFVVDVIIVVVCCLLLIAGDIFCDVALHHFELFLRQRLVHPVAHRNDILQARIDD